MAQLLAARRMERRQLEQRCVSARERLRKVREETGFLTEVNASLEANKGQLEEQIRVRPSCPHTCECRRPSRGRGVTFLWRGVVGVAVCGEGCG